MHLSGFISLVVRKGALYLFLAAMGSEKIDISLLNKAALHINRFNLFECQCYSKIYTS